MTRVLLGKGSCCPSHVHADYDHEQLEGQKKMDCLEHLHDLVGGAAIEIVDVQNDSIDGNHAVVLVASLLPAKLFHEVGQRLKILTNRVDDPEVLLVLLARDP